jgi:hypothetical protein
MQIRGVEWQNITPLLLLAMHMLFFMKKEWNVYSCGR